MVEVIVLFTGIGLAVFLLINRLFSQQEVRQARATLPAPPQCGQWTGTVIYDLSPIHITVEDSAGETHIVFCQCNRLWLTVKKGDRVFGGYNTAGQRVLAGLCGKIRPTTEESCLKKL